MFYADTTDGFLRLGDVVKGYISAAPTIKQPVFNISDIQNVCNIKVEIPVFSVVLTPCCSIEDSMLCLTPLIPLLKDFYKNEHFVNDFTIINREIKPEYCYPTSDWEKMDQTTKLEIEAKKKPYTLLHLFIYDKQDILSPYLLRGHEINYYMIDFRNIQTIKCDMIKRAEKMGPSESVIIESKRLQLSDKTREELRNKLAYYYGRKPEEDIV